MRRERRRDFRDLTGWDEAAERELLERAGRAGLVGVSLPAEYGGGGRPRSWQAVVSFEAAAHDAPLIDTAAVLVAPSVIEFGSDEQRASFAPAAAAGTTTACIAYTEAGAGSDLARVATTAVDDGQGGFVLDGVKVLVTGAHKADWCCTIARTDPQSSGAPRPLDVPRRDGHAGGGGRTASRRPTAGRSATVRFEAPSSVPSTVLGDARPGLATAGRRVARRALAAPPGSGWATRNVQALVESVSREPATRSARDAIADLVIRLFVALRLSERVLALQDDGVASAVEAAMTKVYVTELLQRIARVGGAPWAPDAGTAAGMVRRPLAAGVVRVRDRRAPAPDVERRRQRDPADDDRSVGARAAARATRDLMLSSLTADA